MMFSGLISKLDLYMNQTVSFMDLTPSYDTLACKLFLVKAGYTVLNLPKSGFRLKASASLGVCKVS